MALKVMIFEFKNKKKIFFLFFPGEKNDPVPGIIDLKIAFIE